MMEEECHTREGFTALRLLLALGVVSPMLIPLAIRGVGFIPGYWFEAICGAMILAPNIRNCSPHIIRQTINVSPIGQRLDTKLHEQMKICANSMLCLMARPQIHLPNVKTCLDVVNIYQ